MPAAASAIASGSSRRQPDDSGPAQSSEAGCRAGRRPERRNTISNVSAMAATAAISSPAMELVIWAARSLITTGTPVTV